jgi:hypothetical protein
MDDLVYYPVVAGENGLGDPACTVCTATSGYDEVTGLGSPNVASLAARLFPASGAALAEAR